MIHLCFNSSRQVRGHRACRGAVSVLPKDTRQGPTWSKAATEPLTLQHQCDRQRSFSSQNEFFPKFGLILEGLAATISKWLDLHIHNHFILIKIAASPNCKSTREETLTNLQPRAAGAPESRQQKPETTHQHKHLEIKHFQSRLTVSLCSGRTPGTATSWNKETNCTFREH